MCSLPLSRSGGKKEAMQLRTIFINEGMSEGADTTPPFLSHLSTALSSEWDPPAWHAARTVIGRLIRESCMATHGEMALIGPEKVREGCVFPRLATQLPLSRRVVSVGERDGGVGSMKRCRERGRIYKFVFRGRRTPSTSGGGGGGSPLRKNFPTPPLIPRGQRRNIRSSCGVPNANGPYKFGKVLHIQLLLGAFKGSALKGGRGRGAFGVNAPLWLSGIGDKTHSRFIAREKGC